MTVENGDNMVICKGFQPLKTKEFYLSTFVMQYAIKYKGHELQVEKRVAVMVEI
jgi:hypothetical protein